MPLRQNALRALADRYNYIARPRRGAAYLNRRLQLRRMLIRTGIRIAWRYRAEADISFTRTCSLSEAPATDLRTIFPLIAIFVCGIIAAHASAYVFCTTVIVIYFSLFC